MVAKKKLTDEQIQEALGLYQEGYSYERLAPMFRVSTSTIYAALRPVIGRQRTMARLTEGQKREIVRLYKSGKFNQPQLAVKFGVKPGAIQNVLSRAGALKTLPTPEERESLRLQALKLVKEGKSSKQAIAERLGVGYRAVVGWTNGTSSISKASTTPVQEEQIRRMFETGNYFKTEIAQELGLGVGVVMRVLKDVKGVRTKMRRKGPPAEEFKLRWPDHELGADYEVDPETGCFLWLWSTSGGYARVMWKGKNASVIRLLKETPRGMETRHSPTCGWRTHCVNPDHLTIGTPMENQQDRHKTSPHLEKQLSVLARRRDGLTYQQLADEFGLNKRQVQYIVSDRFTKRVEKLIVLWRQDDLTYRALARKFRMPAAAIRKILSEAATKTD